jgi:cellulose synthase/poly-beta-1,6-N-acetylglucosamine synthase-like glycosyltransferase
VVALAAFATIALSLAYLAWGTTRVAWLRDLPRREPGQRAPRVSIVVPALNEARWIEPALRSLAAPEYPDLEIVAIDDRSTDATPDEEGRREFLREPPHPRSNREATATNLASGAVGRRS